MESLAPGCHMTAAAAGCNVPRPLQTAGPETELRLAAHSPRFLSESICTLFVTPEFALCGAVRLSFHPSPCRSHVELTVNYTLPQAHDQVSHLLGECSQHFFVGSIH